MAARRRVQTIVPTREYPDIAVLPAIGDWENLGHVKVALQEHEQGLFHMVSLMSEAIWTDDAIKGVLTSRLSLLGLPVEFKYGPEEQLEDDLKADLMRDWPRMWAQHAARQVTRWGLMLGAGVGEKLWEMDDDVGRWVPRVKVWHPRYLRWDYGNREYRLITMEGEIAINPEKGPDAKWVLFTPFGYFRGWMDSLVRSLAAPWLIRRFAWRDFARHSEVYGLGIRKAHMPRGGDANDKRMFLASLARLASEGVVKLPTGPNGEKIYDLDLLQADSSSHELFTSLLDACTSAIAKAVVGQTLTSDTGTKGSGSYALGNVHKEVKQEIKDDDATALRECLGPQLLVDWVRFNRGEAKVYPLPYYQTTPPEDMLAKATMLKTVGEASKALREGGVNVDVEQLADDYNIEVSPGPPPEPRGSSPRPGEGGGSGKSLSQDDVPVPPGAMAGQRRADELSLEATAAAVDALRPTVERLMQEVDAATSPLDLRRRVIAAYPQLDAHTLAQVVEKALVLGELSGRFAVLEDFTPGQSSSPNA